MFNSTSKKVSHSHRVDEQNYSIHHQIYSSSHYKFVEDPCISTPGLAFSLLKMIFSKRSTEDQNKLDMDIKEKINEYFIR